MQSAVGLEAQSQEAKPVGGKNKSPEKPAKAAAAPDPLLAPRVLIEHTSKGPRIVAANAAGFQAGAQIGQRLADARAACPHLRVEPADPEGDAVMLERLARFTLRFTPLVTPDGLTSTDAGLMLDIGGCAHLFGGEEAMVDAVVARFTSLGFLTLAGLAPTARAARVLARYGDDPEDDIPPPILDHPMDPSALDAFPVEALDLEDERIVLLSRLGLKTIGAVRALPRASLERRFRSKEAAQSVRWRLDELSGAIAEPLKPIRPPDPYRVAISCPEPLLDVAGVGWALRDLLARLEARLEKEGLGARLFTLAGFSVDGGASHATVRLSIPGRDPERLYRLFEEKLEAIDPGFGLEAFTLSASSVEPMEVCQTGWVPKVVAGGGDDVRLDEDVMALVDRLANRFGTTTAFQLQPVASHVPEMASRLAPIGGLAAALSWDDWHKASPATAPRPTRLLDRPEEADVIAAVPDGPPVQLTWRRVKRSVVRARGPERIAAPWWQDRREDAVERAATRVRDYYDVEDADGRRYWLFRAGLYGDEAREATGEGPPRWYVHGLFQ